MANETQISAHESIKEEGRVMAMSRSSTAPFDPVLGAVPDCEVLPPTTWNVVAITLPATIARFRGIDNKLAEDNNIVLAKARYLLISPLSPDDGSTLVNEPLPEDRVVFSGQTWRLVGCTPIQPDGQNYLFQAAVVLLG